MQLERQIEALLFFKGSQMTIKEIGKILNVGKSAVSDAISALRTALETRGLTLIEYDKSIMLGTHPDMGKVLEDLAREEYERDLGKAGLETLALVLYRSPVSKNDIDYVRGVNSSFILRNLLIRGLVERVQNPSDARGYLYKPSFDVLRHIGVSSLNELPEFEEYVEKLNAFTEDQNGK